MSLTSQLSPLDRFGRTVTAPVGLSPDQLDDESLRFLAAPPTPGDPDVRTRVDWPAIQTAFRAEIATTAASYIRKLNELTATLPPLFDAAYSPAAAISVLVDQLVAARPERLGIPPRPRAPPM